MRNLNALTDAISDCIAENKNLRPNVVDILIAHYDEEYLWEKYVQPMLDNYTAALGLKNDS